MGWPQKHGNSVPKPPNGAGLKNVIFDPRFQIIGSFRPAYYGGKHRTRRPGSREKEIGFERERERERETERDREREREREKEIPEFPKPLAPALRFGSMNPISRLWVHGSMGKDAHGGIMLGIWPKSYNPGGSCLLYTSDAADE